ncbi:sensor domain-containing protein [Pandoraea bronchicola]|uniref:Diguanylate cyclase/phosphodiesterase A protein n=1 Tax=Pandoraea bronchicola TaxID=2508287 RepID=A0A5E5BQJ0_9BURK|nr:EAL domain-containing protein [Pandoraea bronchicola]VVE87325.1 diguanylate cyclase/phosphodiesterase A protein [Pandoraea bronchicola]
MVVPGSPSAAGTSPAPGREALLAALDHSLGMLTLTPDGIIVDVNDKLLGMFGYARTDLIGKPHAILCEPGDITCGDALAQVLSTQRSHTGQVRRHRQDGTAVWLEATYNPVFDDTGKLAFVIKLAVDVTARVERQAADDARLHLLSLGVDETDNAVLITDAQGIVCYVNAGFTRMLGYAASEVVGQSVYVPFGEPPEGELADGASAVVDVKQALAGCLVSARDGRSCHCEVLVRTAQRQPLWVSVVTNPILDASGKLLNAVVLFTDITQSKIQEVLQHKALAAMVRDAPLVEVLTLVCRELEQIAPEVMASVVRVDAEGRLRPQAGPSLPAQYHKMVDGLAIGPNVGTCGTAAFQARPVIVTDIANDPRWANFRDMAAEFGLAASWSMPIIANDGRVLGVLAFYYRTVRGPDALHERLVDVCVHLCKLAFERDESRTRIRQLAFSDSLTGLPNRSMLGVLAAQAIASAGELNTRMAVIFIDLDRFKQVNDSLGHQAGDVLLRTIAQRLRRSLRGADIVARLSGDEFVAVLTECDPERLDIAIERMRGALTASCQVDGVTLAPSGSFGISLYPNHGKEFDLLLQRADMAMYQAKMTSPGSVRVYSEDMNIHAQERLELETAMRDALRRNTLRLFYQPQINLLDESVYGVEALSRWTHPQHGEVSPSRFIALAEECGLIGELGMWTLRESCRQLAEWRQRGAGIENVSVNLSPTNFHDHDLPRMIAEALADHELPPSCLAIEITESVLMDHNPSTLRIIDEVHSMGVRLSMDDFGTGYSSLGYLRRLPVSELKLDRSFVHDITRDETVRALTNAIISIGRNLHLTVVAEGVEDEAQRNLLVAQGYRVAQGYLFSPALSAGDLERWLEQWSARRRARNPVQS